MIGIYKITNIINGKCYIGQSVNIHKRWNNHKSACYNTNAHEYNYYLYRAMRKYGIENFTFEIIEECSQELLDEREIFWISYYDSYVNGYNETEGGNYAKHYIKITPQQLTEIDNLLKCSQLSIQEIADRFQVSYEMIQGINTGRHWHRNNIDYPIGNYIIGLNRNKKSSTANYCIDCGKIISSNSTRCIECSYKRSRKCERPDSYVLLNMVASMPMTHIGKYFGVSDNTIRKWCDYYGIPKKKKEAQDYLNTINNSN